MSELENGTRTLAEEHCALAARLDEITAELQQAKEVCIRHNTCPLCAFVFVDVFIFKRVRKNTVRWLLGSMTSLRSCSRQNGGMMTSYYALACEWM